MQHYIEVPLSAGRVRGRSQHDLAVFRGVRYGAAPTGRHRFRPPEPPAPWADVRDVLEDGPICPQLPSRLGQLMGEFQATQGEDCLSLTIWAPLPLAGERPILVWLHGGGYSSGAGSLAWYDGAKLAQEAQAVVVGVNYRLGVLGYLCHPKLPFANLGLLDQIAAIEWVRENAASLGGDAKRITLIGQSAGAHSIACMMAMPATRSPVRRAILLSTPFGMRTLAAEHAATVSEVVLGQLGIDPNDAALLERLQEPPVGDILKAQLAAARMAARPGSPTPPFGPVGVGDVPDASHFMMEAARGAAGADLFIGTAREELAAFYRFDPRLQALDEAGLMALAQALFGSVGAVLIRDARRRRPGATNLDALIDAQTDAYFLIDTYALARASARGWVYQFDWQAPRLDLMACHCVELPFVFGTLDVYGDVPMLGGSDTRKEGLSAALRAAIGAFAHAGDPNNSRLPEWPQFAAEGASGRVLHADQVFTLGVARKLPMEQ